MQFINKTHETRSKELVLYYMNKMYDAQFPLTDRQSKQTYNTMDVKSILDRELQYLDLEYIGSY